MSKAAGANAPELSNLSKTIHYEYNAAQALSFVFLESFNFWFSEDKKYEMIRLRSTANRLRRINERAETELPETARQFKRITKSKK